MILYFAADLLWASKIKGTADALGLTARPVRTLEMLEARLAEYAAPNPDPIRALIVEIAPSQGTDEAEPSKLEIAMALIRRAQAVPGVRVLAFGPHVEVEALRAAKAAGAGAVMTRGTFGDRLPEVLQDLARQG
jgi:hypothetical protein